MPPGRPSRLTKQVADNLVKAVGLGLSYKDAAAVAGIGQSTFHEWKKRAELATRTNKYTKLMERIDAALQKSVLQDIVIEKTHVKRLPDGTEIKEIPKETRPPDVKGAFWWLERIKSEVPPPRRGRLPVCPGYWRSARPKS